MITLSEHRNINYSQILSPNLKKVSGTQPKVARSVMEEASDKPNNHPTPMQCM